MLSLCYVNVLSAWKNGFVFGSCFLFLPKNIGAIDLEEIGL